MTSSSADPTNTLTDYLEAQQSLQQEAALALPQSFSTCTYNLGPLRQPIYLCRTCAVPRGICSACSIACHPDHEQLELFPKRRFRCDCPTSALKHPCSLRKTEEGVNVANVYGKNFEGSFCRCGREYDALKEVETMIQCLACEDWFHESCLNLRERPGSEANAQPTNTTPAASAEQSEDHTADVDDGASDASSSGLPPPLITANAYDCLVCTSCVRRMPLLQHYAGTSGVKMVVRSNVGEPWRVYEGASVDSAHVDVAATSVEGEVGRKRALSSADASDPKRLRLSNSSNTPSPSEPCLKPPRDAIARRIFASLSAETPDASLGAGDIFLTEGWRTRWCRCSSCLPQLEEWPYLLEEEETYEPPEDPDSQLSLEELGMRALVQLPRDRAIEGIHAFNAMKDGLMRFLRPFAQEGRVVAEGDIKDFFNGIQGSKS